MKHWVLALMACGAVSAVAACSSDDSSGGGGTGGATGGVGGVITGGSGGLITGGSGGSTGGSGGSTGGTGGGTGGATADCNDQLMGQPCSVLQATDPAQNACLQGECCDEVTACLADAQCAALTYCGSACLQGGGTQAECGALCQECGGATLYNAINTCITACVANPTDGGTGGAPADGGGD